MQKKYAQPSSLFLLICISIIAGFCSGLIPFGRDILANRYAAYGMYRLIGLSLQEHLNRWLIFFLILFVCSYIIITLLQLLGQRVAELIKAAQGQPYARGVFTLLPYVLFFIISSGVIGAYTSSLLQRFTYVLAVLLAASCTGWVLANPETKRRLAVSIRNTSLGLLAVILGLNCALLVESKVWKPEGPNIVLIVIDCLRPDHLGCYGYQRETSPTLDRLAQQGAVFTQAYANAPWTKPSVASMFTSLYPNVHNVRNGYAVMPSRLVTIAETLRNSGYQTWFFNGGNEFIERRYNFPQGFDTYVFRSREHFNAYDVTSEFLACLSKAQNSRFFAYLHYMDAHAPYTRNEYNYLFTNTKNKNFEPGNKNALFKKIRLLTHTNQMHDDTKRYIKALYDAQIRFVDENIQRITAALQAGNLNDNTFLIITSDHGEEFWDHYNFEHGHSLYNELLHVPLIITGPGISKAAIPQAVRLIDIAPTILELTHSMTIPGIEYQGISLVPYLQGRTITAAALPVFATGVLYGPEKYCLIRDGKKIIQNTKEKHKKWNLLGYQNSNPIELYDIEHDQREQTHLGDSICQQALQKELETFKTLNPLVLPDDSPTAMNDDVKQKLESLGYIQ